jgi:thiol-disulfide isomerase/thioredoxin
MLVVLFCVVGAACSNTHSSSEAAIDAPAAAPAPVPKPIPQFELENVAGGSLKSENLKGKVTILDFWATWCEPCLAEISNYNRLKARYAGRDVEIIGMTMQSGSLNDIKGKVKELQVEYSVVRGDDNIELAFGGVLGYPTTFLIAKDGTIFKKYLGVPPGKDRDLEKQIEHLLSQ